MGDDGPSRPSRQVRHRRRRSRWRLRLHGRGVRRRTGRVPRLLHLVARPPGRESVPLRIRQPRRGPAARPSPDRVVASGGASGEAQLQSRARLAFEPRRSDAAGLHALRPRGSGSVGHRALPRVALPPRRSRRRTSPAVCDHARAGDHRDRGGSHPRMRTAPLAALSQCRAEPRLDELVGAQRRRTARGAGCRGLLSNSEILQGPPDDVEEPQNYRLIVRAIR